MRTAWWIAGSLIILLFDAIALYRWKGRADHPWQILGLEFNRITVIDALVGFLIGAFAMVGIFSVEMATGLIQVSGWQNPQLFILFGAFWYLPRAFAEELFCRGLMLNGFCMLVPWQRKWLAVAISAVAFGFIHALNPYASEISVLGNALGGVVYALAYLRSGSLWLGIGLHFGWNLVQGTILGFPVSGTPALALVHQIPTGDTSLTGGAYGPEAGLVGIGFRFVAIAGVLLWTLRARDRWQGPFI